MVIYMYVCIHTHTHTHTYLLKYLSRPKMELILPGYMAANQIL